MIKNIDIARALNISTATVSLVRNNKPGVSEETKNAVNELIRSMMMKETIKHDTLLGTRGTVAFVIHKKHGYVIADTPFFLTLTESVQRMALDNNFQANILHFNEQDNLADHLNRCADPSINGILLLASEMKPADLQPYLQCGKPLVVLDSHYPDETLDAVFINNRDAVRKAVKYAWQMGHRQIGFLRSRIYTANFDERFLSYLDTMRELGGQINPDDIIDLGCTSDTAYEDMKRILAKRDKLPTLLVAGNDLLAIGALKALKEQKIAVPDQVSIIGFDDMPISRMMDPPLTSIRIYHDELAKVAIKRLIEKIQGDCGNPLNIEVAASLMIRESVKQL